MPLLPRTPLSLIIRCSRRRREAAHLAQQVSSEALQPDCDENLHVLETTQQQLEGDVALAQIKAGRGNQNCAYMCNCPQCSAPHRRSSLLPALERLDFTDVLKQVAARPECARESGRQCGRGSFPLHDVLYHNPPMDVVGALLEACPEAAKFADSGGWLPLHHAVQYGASVDVVIALLNANRDAVFTQDNCSRVPLDRADVHPAPPEVRTVLKEVMNADREQWLQRQEEKKRIEQETRIRREVDLVRVQRAAEEQRIRRQVEREHQVGSEVMQRQLDETALELNATQQELEATAQALKAAERQLAEMAAISRQQQKHATQDRFASGSSQTTANSRAEIQQEKTKKRRPRRGGMWKRRVDLVSIPDTLDEFR